MFSQILDRYLAAWCVLEIPRIINIDDNGEWPLAEGVNLYNV